MKAIIALFIFSLFLFFGCGASTVQYTMENATTKVSGDITVYSSQGINAVTKQVSALTVLFDPSLSATDRALQLSYITNMKDIDVQVIEQRSGVYGHMNYAGSNQQTRDMEIDALTRYREYQINKTKKK
jgi:hypothetical protein